MSAARLRSLPLALLLAAACADAKVMRSGTELAIVSLTDPNALCNDGSNGAFYFAPATDPAKSDLWLIYLQGGAGMNGGWCYDSMSCLVRAMVQNDMTSSHRWPTRVKMGGIFDANPKRNPWAGANMVFVGYCSSDAWVGNAGPNTNPWGWSYRGQAILAATIARLTAGVSTADLGVPPAGNRAMRASAAASNSGGIAAGMPRMGFGRGLLAAGRAVRGGGAAGQAAASAAAQAPTVSLTASSRVLLSGCSAGARGAMANLDYMSSLLPPGAPPARGFFDSALWVDLEPANPDQASLANQTQAVFALVNATGRLGAACAAANPGAAGWRCLFPEYRLPFIAAPYLLSGSQFDKAQLQYDAGGPPPYDSDANASFASAFQGAVRAVAQSLPVRGTQPRSAVYSSACFAHCTSTVNAGAFWGVRVNNIPLRTFLADWYFGAWRPGAPLPAPALASSSDALPAVLPSQQLIEACNGFGCGQCHAASARPAPPLPPAYTLQLLPAPPAAVPLASSAFRGGRAAAAPSGSGARVASSSEGAAIMGGSTNTMFFYLSIACGAAWFAAQRRRGGGPPRLAAMGGVAPMELRERGAPASPSAGVPTPWSPTAGEATSLLGGAAQASDRVVTL